MKTLDDYIYECNMALPCGFLDVIATYILRDSCYCKYGFCIIGIRIIGTGMKEGY